MEGNTKNEDHKHMIIKIEDTYINLDKVHHIVPFKDAKGNWTIRVSFSPSGYVNIGEYDGKDIANRIISNAEVIKFHTKSV